MPGNYYEGCQSKVFFTEHFLKDNPAGIHKVSAKGVTEVKVGQGKSVLIPLRVGKWMVD